jgi:hypothetical protein
VSPEEYKEAMAAFDTFARSLCDVKKGDRFQLKKDLKGSWDRSRRSYRLIAKAGEKATVQDITISGLSARIQMDFDSPSIRTQWVWVQDIKDLDILDQLSEI